MRTGADVFHDAVHDHAGGYADVEGFCHAAHGNENMVVRSVKHALGSSLELRSHYYGYRIVGGQALGFVSIDVGGGDGDFVPI